MTSDCLQENSASVQGGNSVSLGFTTPPGNGDTLVVMVAYHNQNNRNTFVVSGDGATWTPGYAPKLKKGFGAAFFYGVANNATANTITVTSAQSDNLIVTAQEWINLSTIEDKKARKVATGKSATPKITVRTKNANDVILNVIVYGGPTPPLSSPPTGNFLFMGNAGNTYQPIMQGGYVKTSAKGKYTNSFILQSSTTWVSFTTALESIPGPNQLFSATPLTDFAPGETYEGYPGLLYNGSNTDSGQHDLDGKAIANSIGPLDANGNPSQSGQIVMVGMGPSNWTEELCTGSHITPQTGPNICDPNTFFDQAENQLSTLFPGKALNPSLLLVDCARGGAFIDNWLDLTSDAWTGCVNGGPVLSAYGVTQAQVQIIAFMDDDAAASGYLSSLNGGPCPPNPSLANGDPNACVYEYNLGNWARLAKQEFPNLKMIFLQGRTYGGYASKEPLPYENNFAIKWFIQAQINQLTTHTPDPVAGDLSYGTPASPAPWIGWGAYTWGSGATPRADGNSWPGGNFAFDGIHPSRCTYASPWSYCGRGHDANLMLQFYTSSPYATHWFLVSQ